MEETNKPQEESKRPGDVLNQIAIISELVENINFEASMNSIVFEFEHDEFKRVYELVQKKAHILDRDTTYRFSMRVGSVDFIFISTEFYNNKDTKEETN